MTNDTIQLSLGRDKGIAIKRTKEKDFQEKQFIGNKQQITIGWRLEIRNNKAVPLEVVMEDQYPVASSSTVEVRLEEGGGALVDKTTGKLTWATKLKPGESQTLNFRYSVKYPKGMRIRLE